MRRHEKGAAWASPLARSSSRRASASRIDGGDRLGALGVGANRSVAAGFVERGMRRGDDRRARRHRLGDRHPEALEPRGVDDRGGAPVEARELGVGDAAEPDDARPVELRLLAPARSADDGEREPGVGKERVRLDQRAEVLARLERGHRQQVGLTEIGRLARRR